MYVCLIGPDVTPATYKSSEEKKSFIELIGKLKARGGGDCPEEAIEGIQKIYTASPKFDSPVYVFTDAGAKDASADNLELLIDTAYNFYYTPINFFLSNSGELLHLSPCINHMQYGECTGCLKKCIQNWPSIT